ncbi:MAG: serine/threonine protein kinase, partial [Candidatus Obscuribacterales bacterium]|nr:serine/threonine protein kinase [Candidatus Obscuribacterales bacterium]
SRLDHENIIGIFDFGITENAQAFMVMEYIVGWSLYELVKKEGAFPLDFALDVGIQICSGMAHAHTAGILHRDLKPANILLKHYEDRAPLVKIVDFGLAKWSDQRNIDSPELTRDGQIIGSPMYMSPEQARALAMDERSDIYTVGCIIYEMFTGCPPHFADSSMDMIMKHLTEEPLALAELRPDLQYPSSCEPLIRKALQKDPEKRYQSMRELKEDLQRIKSEMKTLKSS